MSQGNNEEESPGKQQEGELSHPETEAVRADILDIPPGTDARRSLSIPSRVGSIASTQGMPFAPEGINFSGSYMAVVSTPSL